MKLPIRVKFFVVLLAFSLGPVFLSRIIMGRASSEMVTDLSASTRSELLAIVSAELEHNAMSLLTTLNARGEAMSLSARLLAQRAEHFIDWQQVDDTIPLHFEQGFTMQGATMTPAGRSYIRKGRMGGVRALEATLDFPTVRLAPNSDKPLAMTQLKKLQGLMPTFKAIYSELGNASYWFNIALESGAYLTFPGHGGMPAKYDHRDQKWYATVRERNNGRVWITPNLDPATRAVVATVAFPIQDKAGRFQGAASIDVPIAKVLGGSDLKSRWSGEILSFMVARPTEETQSSEGLLILAQQSYGAQGHRHWKSGIEREFLTPDDSGEFKKLIEAMLRSTSGNMILRYKGKPYVWAYASNQGISFLLITPKAVVAQLPDHVAGSLTSLFGRLRAISSVMAGLMILIVGLIAWVGSRRITRPLLVMVDAVKRLAAGDFSVRIPHHTRDEREALIDALNEMGPALKERMLLRRDLELAQEVQNLLLPRTGPELSGWDISGGIAFCDQTGGDYYDFIPVLDNSGEGLNVVLGDVSGHGVPSALVMATARGQLHALAKVPLSPAARIRAVNNVLSTDLDGTGRFLTLFYLRLAADSGQVTWVRAGHDPAMRYNPGTNSFGELAGEGLPLGVIPGEEYESYTAEIMPGEVLVLATDGVWEARNGAGEMFGKQRMLAIIRESAHISSQEIRYAIMDAVEVFQENGQNDDIAVVVVKKVRE